MQLPGTTLAFGTRLAWLARCLLLLLAAQLLAPSSALAQTYAYRNDVFAYDTPTAAASSVGWHASGTNPVCTGFPNGDDDFADVSFPTGFAFTFGGVSYSGVRVYSNGILAYGSDVSGFYRNYSAKALPINAPPAAGPTGCVAGAVPVRLMLPYWIDIIAGNASGITGAAVKYELLGTAPNRRFVITWDNVALYGNATTRYSFQVALYESTAGTNGNFRYQYTTGSSTGTNATVGVQLSTADYTQYAYNQPFIDTTLGTSVVWYPANQLATKSAEYHFNEAAWLGTPGEIKDTSGNGQNGVRVGVATTVPDAYCRGGAFASNTSVAVVTAAATPIVPGNQGSIDFWYNSNANWNSAAAMLFDASTAANRPFFLMKSATGALTFVVSDNVGATLTATAPAQSFLLNTWHHVGVTWNLRAGTNQTVLQVFLDGALQNGGPIRGTTNGVMPALGTLYFGDNRTVNVTPNGGSPNSTNGILDEVYIYSVEVSAPQILSDKNLVSTSCAALDHFDIKHDGTVSNCGAIASITIEAHDVNHNLFTLAGTTINLSTDLGHGTWSNITGGAISPLSNVVAGSGTASYTFSNENRVTFGLSDTASESLNINVNSGGITELSGAAAVCVAADASNASGLCDVSRAFTSCKPFGFNCVESGTNAISGRLFTKLAGTAFSFDVVALKDANGGGTADAVETNYASDGDKTVTLELVDGSGATACSARTAIATAGISPAANLTLKFLKINQATEQGRKSLANITVSKAYRDLRCRVTDANQSPSIVACSGDDFAVRPTDISFSTSASATPPSASAAPTVKAGAGFTLQAVIGTDTGYTGSLVQDASKLTAQITTQDTSIAPGGVVGTLTPSSLAANTSITTATYSEVGHVYLAPAAYRDDNYSAVDQPSGCAASGTCDCVTDTTSGNYLSNSPITNTISGVTYTNRFGCSFGNGTQVALGRFTPEHFSKSTAVAPQVVYGCPAGAFTYMDQPFSFSANIEARTLANTVTQNYSGKFARGTVAAQAVNNNNATPLGSRVTLASASWDAGVPTGKTGGVYTFNATKFARPVSATPDASWGSFDNLSLGMLVTDADGVLLQGRGLDEASTGCTADSSGTSDGTCKAVLLASGAKFRYGRLRLQNAYGSERLPLLMPLEAQYWSGSAYNRNTLDSCTSLAVANVNLVNYQGGLSALNMGNSHVGTVAAFAAGLSSVRLDKPSPVPSVMGGVDVFLNIGASGASSTCPVVNASPQTGSSAAALPFLASNWCGASSYDRAPSARATLGVYKSPLIYRRENY